MMTERERFLRYMRFEKVDRIPLMEMGIWDETLDRWRHEGLPKWVTDLRHLEDYLDLDRSFNMNWLPISQETYPPFERQLIADQGEVLLMRDERGITFRQQKRYKTIPEFIEFPIKTLADYEHLRERFDGKSPGRYAEDFDEDLRFRRQRGEIIGVNFRSFFGFPRNYSGMENWCMAFYDQEELVTRMIADRLQFAKDVFARAIAAGGVDFIQIWEDMAYKTSSMISPQHVRQYMLPAYRELVSFLRQRGVQLLMVDCDGRVDELLPIWLEAGIDGCHPCEIAAGSDPVALRRRHPRVTLMGGMDKRAIAAGREGIDGELKRVQPLLKEGAYIPMLDHFVPPDVSYENYVYYVERRRELLANPYGKLRKYL
jgi:uroporphyrinogen decarboxylase